MALEFDSSKWTGEGSGYDKIVYTAADAENVLASTLAAAIVTAGVTGLFNLAGAGLPWWVVAPPAAVLFLADALSLGKAVPQSPKEPAP